MKVKKLISVFLLISFFLFSTVNASTTYTVTITPDPTSAIEGQRVLFTIVAIGNDNSTLTSYISNITRDGGMFREGWDTTIFADTAPSPQSHVYSIGGIMHTNGTALNFTVTPVTVAWKGRGGVVTKSDVPEPLSTSLAISGIDDDTESDMFSALSFVGIVCVSILFLLIVNNHQRNKKKHRNVPRTSPIDGTKIKRGQPLKR